MSKLEFPEKTKLERINDATVAIVKGYLDYLGQIVTTSMNKQGYGSHFKEIDDELVVKPSELIELIDKVQRALDSIDD